MWFKRSHPLVALSANLEKFQSPNFHSYPGWDVSGGASGRVKPNIFSLVTEKSDSHPSLTWLVYDELIFTVSCPAVDWTSVRSEPHLSSPLFLDDKCVT